MTGAMWPIPAWAVIAGDAITALRNSRGPQRDHGREALALLASMAMMVAGPFAKHVSGEAVA